MGVALFPLARRTVYEELFLGVLKKIPKTVFFPEGEALGHLSCGAKP